MKRLYLLVFAAIVAISAGSDLRANGLSDHLRETGVVEGDYFPDISLRGRFHLDGGWHDEDNAEFGDGINVRRARMGISGDLDPHWSFLIEYDFAEENVTANDVMLVREFGHSNLKFGQFKVPMGLNELTSSNNITFIERASNSNIIVDSRRLGIGYDCHADAYGIQSMVYSRAMGGREEGDMPIGLAARAYANPIYVNGLMLHVGLSAAYENRRDYDSLRFRDRPEARADPDVRLIDTGEGNVENVDMTFKTGVELAFQRGPFSMEAEYLTMKIDNDGPDPRISGYHVQASYVLTGEARGYRNGVFRGITPKHAYGAWEAAVRWSSVDLNDSAIYGGEQENLTLGVNYYPGGNVRFMANAILVDVDDSLATGIQDDKPTIFLLRGQFSF
jgi:phosphate-selective porin OprO and OprP